MAEQTSSSPNGSPSTSRVLRNQAAASPSSKRRSTTVADKATPPARTCKTRATASAGPSLMTTTTSTAFTLRHPLHVQIDASTLDQLPNITCVVCLGAPDPAATVACGHVFCEPCVLQLFQASNPPHHCPTCRQRFNRRQVRILQFPVAQVTMMTAAAHGDAKVGVANPLARGNAGANSVGKKDVPKEGDGSEDNTAESSSHRKRRRGLSTTQTTVVSTTTGTGTTPLRSSRSIATAHPDGGPNRQTVIDLDSPQRPTVPSSPSQSELSIDRLTRSSSSRTWADLTAHRPLTTAATASPLLSVPSSSSSSHHQPPLIPQVVSTTAPPTPAIVHPLETSSPLSSLPTSSPDSSPGLPPARFLIERPDTSQL